jgi:tetratricopeptide (TPR) repeat protein
MDQLQSAIQHFNSGRFSDSERIVREILNNDPINAIAYHLLGVLELRTNRFQDAVTHLSKAIEIEPQYVNAYNDLANALKASDQTDQVIAIYERLLSIHPNDALAHYHLGNAFAGKGMYSEAKESFLRSVKINPRFANAMCDLATALGEMGDIPAAAEWYYKSIELNPRLDLAYAGLARTLALLNDSMKAIRILCAALQQIPDSFIVRHSLSELLDCRPFPEVGANERRILLDLLEDPNITSQSLAVAVAGAIEGMTAFQNVRHAILINGDIHAALKQAAFFEDTLLIVSLPRLAVQSVEMEQIFTAIRREYLFSEKPVLPVAFVCALAQHCFLTEYVWQVEEKEEEQLSALIAAVTSILREASINQASLETHLTKIALYKPLYELLSGSSMEALAVYFRYFIRHLNRR